MYNYLRMQQFFVLEPVLKYNCRVAKTFLSRHPYHRPGGILHKSLKCQDFTNVINIYEQSEEFSWNKILCY